MDKADAWFCVVFEVCVWIIIQLEDPNMAHCLFFLPVGILSVGRNKMSSRNIGPQHQTYSSIFNGTQWVLLIPVFTGPILSVCC